MSPNLEAIRQSIEALSGSISASAIRPEFLALMGQRIETIQKSISIADAIKLAETRRAESS
jgi:hypothetical protein